MGIDFGEKNIGIALSDPLQNMAFPYKTLKLTSYKTLIHEINEIIVEKNVHKIILGIPKNLKGEIAFQAEKVLDFKKHLEEQIKISVDDWDERLTSKMVERAMTDACASSNKIKKYRDELSAQLILQGYLDFNRNQKE